MILIGTLNWYYFSTTFLKFWETIKLKKCDIFKILLICLNFDSFGSTPDNAVLNKPKFFKLKDIGSH